VVSSNGRRNPPPPEFCLALLSSPRSSAECRAEDLAVASYTRRISANDAPRGTERNAATIARKYYDSVQAPRNCISASFDPAQRCVEEPSRSAWNASVSLNSERAASPPASIPRFCVRAFANPVERNPSTGREEETAYPILPISIYRE